MIDSKKTNKLWFSFLFFFFFKGHSVNYVKMTKWHSFPEREAWIYFGKEIQVIIFLLRSILKVSLVSVWLSTVTTMNPLNTNCPVAAAALRPLVLQSITSRTDAITENQSETTLMVHSFSIFRAKMENGVWFCSFLSYKWYKTESFVLLFRQKKHWRRHISSQIKASQL